jgi:uncharacterized protein YbaP (TraB family)
VNLRTLLSAVPVAVLVVLIQPGLATNLYADVAPNYHTLPGSKALAEVPGTAPSVFGIAHSQATDLAASRSAMANCEANRPPSARPCEISRLNDEAVTTGAQIRARANAQPHPLYLWRLRSQTATVFLAGSIHILKPSLYPLPRQLQAAFDQADFLVLEVDTEGVSSADLQAISLRHALLQAPQTLSDVLPEALYARLNEHLAVYGMNADAVGRAKPAVVMNELVLARLTALGYLSQHGLEQHFRAQLGTKSILELESIDAQLRLLFDQPLATQVQLLTDTLDQEYLIEPLLTGMLVAWLSGDDKQFLALFEQQAGDSELAKAFNRQLLDERNVGMANKVAGYLNGQGTYFVLAGAAHFIGPEGIVALLARQGISGHRISSNESLSALIR